MSYILPFKTEDEVKDFMRKEYTDRLKIPVPEIKFFDGMKQYKEYIKGIDNWPILPLKPDWPYRQKSENDVYGDPDKPELPMPYHVIPYAEEIHVLRPFKVVSRNEEGLIHSEDNFALQRQDGEAQCYWRNTPVDNYIIMNPEKITMEDITGTQNIEIRQLKIMKYGLERWLKEQNAEVIDTDFPGNIIRSLLRAKDGSQFLCTSDGSTDRVWTIPVNRNAKTCVEAGQSLAGGLVETDCVAEA